MIQEEKTCGDCIFLKGTFCKYFGEYREAYYEPKEHNCFEPHMI